MSLRRVGLSNSLSSQAKITSKRLTLSRVSLRRFPFPTAAAATAVVNYIEEMFATSTYTGNESTISIVNGIDSSTYGGLVWIKSRTSGTTNDHFLFDTNRGTNKRLSTNLTDAEQTGAPISTTGLTNFNNNGFTLGNGYGMNRSGQDYVSWTFRKQAKFLDIVTYTGNGSTQNISHSLGSEPGCVIIKSTTAGEPWVVWHRGLSFGYTLLLNTTAAQDGPFTNVFGNNSSVVLPSTTQVTVGSSTRVNQNGQGYVMYVFAHNAGGFGLTGSDNVITCAAFNNDNGSVTVDLGYEPQFILYRRVAGGSWMMLDTMRRWVLPGVSQTGSDLDLQAQSSAAESQNESGNVTPTGFRLVGLGVNTDAYICIAIRRGPMKTPTSGTSVFNPLLATGGTSTTSPIEIDSLWSFIGAPITGSAWVTDRLRQFNFASPNGVLFTGTSTTGVEVRDFSSLAYFGGTNQRTLFFNNTGVYHCFRRAPNFFDVVTYLGTGSARTISHNLGVTPEMIIVKGRTSSSPWTVYHVAFGSFSGPAFNSSAPAYWSGSGFFNNTSPTSTVFSLGTSVDVNKNADSFIAWMFSSCSGVSKVGSYTGNGSSQTIDCSFTTGARYILIKRTDLAGDWYVWDSARGIVAGNDSRVAFNNSNSEVTTDDSIDPDNTGFIVNQVAATNINVTSATYLFLAIA